MKSASDDTLIYLAGVNNTCLIPQSRGDKLVGYCKQGWPITEEIIRYAIATKIHGDWRIDDRAYIVPLEHSELGSLLRQGFVQSKLIFDNPTRPTVRYFITKSGRWYAGVLREAAVQQAEAEASGYEEHANDDNFALDC